MYRFAVILYALISGRSRTELNQSSMIQHGLMVASYATSCPPFQMAFLVVVFVSLISTDDLHGKHSFRPLETMNDVL